MACMPNAVVSGDEQENPRMLVRLAMHHYYPIILTFTVCATQDIEHSAAY